LNYRARHDRVGVMTGLEILDRVALGRTLIHRDHDALDLLDADGLVAAVLCPRKLRPSISPPAEGRVRRAPAGRRILYGEKVEWKITEDQIARGIEIVLSLAPCASRSRVGP
jgi:hypothetical protein